MKNRKKRFFTFLMSIVMLFSLNINSFAYTHDYSNDVETINNFWEFINDDNWNKWLYTFSESVRPEYAQLISIPSNFENNVGILNVKNSKVLNITKAPKESIPSIYNTITPNLITENTNAYYVTTELEVNADSDYFSNGENTYLFTTTSENGKSYILTISKVENNIMAREALGYGFNYVTSEPTSITVKYRNGAIATISMSDYVFNATCNEIGNENYADAAVIANALAIKMCGWWAKRGHYFPVGGYDIYYGRVAIDSVNNASASNQTRIRQLVNSMMSYRALSSNNMLFFMNYQAGSYNGNGYHSGEMMQNGSSYLANQGYTWDQILHYYYDNSSLNNPGVGIITLRR